MSETPLETRVQSSNWEVTKGLIVPLYGFKIWNDDRKASNGRIGAIDLLEVVQIEMFKTIGYTVVTSAVINYFS